MVETPDNNERLNTVMSWIAVIAAIVFAAAAFIMIVYAASTGYWNEIVDRHFPVTVGLPCAALAAMFIVLVLKTVAGRIEVKIIGFEFKGAAGPIIMWILSFLAIVLAINTLWDKTVK
jgi:hypothetical protein